MHKAQIKEVGSNTKKDFNIALVGNPNSGKSSVFNQLTGLRQKVGNFPGVTVDKKSGFVSLDDGIRLNFIDFPGAYSLYPTSSDEEVVLQYLLDPGADPIPDLILYVADVTSLEKHLLLFTQVRDLGYPAILVLNMIDQADKEGLQIDSDKLSRSLNAQVISISGRKGTDIQHLKNSILASLKGIKETDHRSIYTPNEKETTVIRRIKSELGEMEAYKALLYAHHYNRLQSLSADEKLKINAICSEEEFTSLKFQIAETLQRYQYFTPIVKSGIVHESEGRFRITRRFDSVLTDRFLGPLIFGVLMLLVFQAIFAWSTYPMDWIDQFFSWVSGGVTNLLPAGWFTSLLTDGILAGLGGIMVFIPQIAILFFLIAILEEVGYMARAVFLFDRLMKKFGLNGRSIVALVSGGACAIPAVMSTRTISNWKEKLITILVTPLISCSARIPVYAILIGLVVPATMIGVFNLQGLAFLALYMLGIVAALLSALAFKMILKSREPSFLMIEMPPYRMPDFRNVFFTVYEKVMAFVIEAGKIIMIISVILWVLASYGPPKDMKSAVTSAQTEATTNNLSDLETENLIAAKKIEASYAGHLGKFIEPVIKPLGYDWKIGIALITSFAAREVFVGTMATIYSIGSAEDEGTVKDKMAKEKDSEGNPVYTFATSMSLLIFYVFAMQCMSTLAIVRRETGTWKWPLIQFLFMGALAYLGALITYWFLGGA